MEDHRHKCYLKPFNEKLPRKTVPEKGQNESSGSVQHVSLTRGKERATKATKKVCAEKREENRRTVINQQYLKIFDKEKNIKHVKDH